MKLLDKHELFINEYIVDLNASHAAIRAGYPKRTSAIIGHRLLKNPSIRKRIDDRMHTIAEKTGLVVEDVLKNLEIVRKDAMLYGKHAPALRALELQGRYLSMFTDKVDVGGTVRVYNCEP